MIDFIESIRDQNNACTTRTCKENNCGLKLSGIPASTLAIIHGTKYQRINGFTDKLCDRIIFCLHQECIIAAVELKGGNSIHLSRAITQIQNGLTLASNVLDGHVVDDWFPLLIYSGRMGPTELKLLRTRSVAFRGRRKIVGKWNCNSPLSAILST